jgi:hypothetical protein
MFKNLRFKVAMMKKKFNEDREKTKQTKFIRNYKGNELVRAKKLIEIDIFNIKYISLEIQNDSEFQGEFMKVFDEYLKKVAFAENFRAIPEDYDKRKIYFYNYFNEDITEIIELIESDSLKLLIKLQQ